MENLRIVQAEGDGPIYSVPRLIASIKAVSRAADLPPLQMPFKDDGTMEFPTIAQFSADLRGLIARAMEAEGSLTVRFLGDLKPTVYPVDTQFFQFRENTNDGGEFSRLVQKAMLESDKQEITLVNLATVRDVKLRIGNQRVLGVGDDIRFLDLFCEALEAWANTSTTIRVIGD